MSTELDPIPAAHHVENNPLAERAQPQDLVIPGTGEVVNLEDPAEVARALGSVSDLSKLLWETKQALIALLVEEAQRQGTKTLHLEGAKVTITGGQRLKWDVAKLLELKEAGLPETRLTDFLKPVLTYKPDGHIAKQLEGSGNETYAQIIQQARTYEPAPWSATVEVRQRQVEGHE